MTQIRRPRLIDPQTVKEEEIKWLWFEKFALGMLTLISGLAGHGKSFFSIFLASRITTGRNWSDETQCEKGAVVFFSSEDNPAIVKKRLLANGADLSLVRIYDATEITEQGRDDQEASFTFADLDIIEQAIRQTQLETGHRVQMVVFDPIGNYWGDVHPNNEKAVRSVLMPLQRLAEQTETMFLLIHHDGKTRKSCVQQRSLGASGIPGVCRAVWSIVSTNDKSLILTPSKINFCKPPLGIEFRIDREKDGMVEIIDTELDMTADQVAEGLRRNQAQTAGRKAKEILDAENWLWDFLSKSRMACGSTNPTPGTIRYEGVAAGHSWATLRRAANNIQVIKATKPENGVYYWCLPNEQDTVPPPMDIIDEISNDSEPTKAGCSKSNSEQPEDTLNSLENMGYRVDGCSKQNFEQPEFTEKNAEVVSDYFSIGDRSFVTANDVSIAVSLDLRTTGKVLQNLVEEKRITTVQTQCHGFIQYFYARQDIDN